MPSVKTSIERSRKIPKTLKAEILDLTLSTSKYNNGVVTGLKKPFGLTLKSRKARCVSFGADVKGFFVYTHRARSKSYRSWRSIPKKDIDFIESTG